MGLFGKTNTKSPTDQVREWNGKLRKECRQLDRQILSIHREEEKVKRSLKEAAKKGDKESCLVLAKEILNSRKAVNRIHVTKAQINSVSLTMKNQLATVKLAGSLQKSTEVMKSMQRLIKIPEVAAAMREMSKEMTKAGIMEEMLEDTLEGMDDQEDLEEAAQEEVDKIIWEVTAGQLGKAPAAVSDTLSSVAGASADADEEDEDEDVSEMQARLEALRS